MALEELDEAARAITRQERRGTAALWFGVLGSPLAWAGQLGLNYSLEEWFACSESATSPGKVLSLPVETVGMIVNTAMAAVALLAGLVAFRCYNKLKDASGGDEIADRARWMAFAGIVEGPLFLAVILLGYVPLVVLDVCETTP